MTNKMVIVGIGHPHRGDDAVGTLAIEYLRQMLPAHIPTQTCLGDMASLLDLFQQFETVYLIDAMVTNENTPGTLFRLNEVELATIASQCRTSTHAFDLGQTIDMARSLEMLPKQLVLFGIEARQFEAGATLSPAVKQALPRLVEMIIKELIEQDKELSNA